MSSVVDLFAEANSIEDLARLLRKAAVTVPFEKAESVSVVAGRAHASGGSDALVAFVRAARPAVSRIGAARALASLRDRLSASTYEELLKPLGKRVDGLGAEDLLRASIDICAEHLGVVYPHAKNDLGILYSGRGEHAEAERQHRESIEAISTGRVLFDPGVNPREHLAIQLNNLATVLHDLPGRLPEAAGLYYEAHLKSPNEPVFAANAILAEKLIERGEAAEEKRLRWARTCPELFAGIHEVAENDPEWTEQLLAWLSSPVPS